MRVTRAAQRAQQNGEEHPAAPEAHACALKDIEPNTPPVASADEPLPAKTPAKTPAKKGKGKPGRKGAKSKHAKTDEDPVQDDEEAELQAIASTASETAVQGPSQGHQDGGAETVSNDEHTVVPQTPAVRLTRRQLAKLEQEEALGKAQNAPPATEEATADVETEQAAEQAQTVPAEELDTVPEVEPPATQEEPAPVGTKSAPKSARRTRRQQAKLEEEQPADQIIENAGEHATANPAAESTAISLHATVEAQHATEQDGTATVNEAFPDVGPEKAPKPKRSTRRQQAKHEDEHEQQTPRSKSGQESGTEAVPEVWTETIDVQEGGPNKQAEIEVIEVEEPTPPAPTTDRLSNTDGKLDAKLREVVETEAVPEDSSESQADGCQTVDAVTVNEEFTTFVDARPVTPTDAEFDANFETPVDHQAINGTLASVEFASEVEPKMLCDEKPFETSMSTPTKNQVATQRSPRSPSKSPMRIEESISAIDRLEEDLESIGTAIPDLGHSDNEKSPRGPTMSTASTAAHGKTPGKTPSKTSSKTSSKTPGKTPVRTSTRPPAKVVSKTPSKMPVNAPVAAKASLASRKTEASLATKVSRVPTANPKSVKPTTTSLARASSIRTVPNKDVRKPSTETADYLASKRHPISLSFPTPPPPPKGRAPTKAIFHLSSDNVAAKLRAQKEERLRREAELPAARRQRPISMPPPAKSIKPPTIPSFQLPGEATAARLKAQKEERLKRMEEAGGTEKPVARPISMSAISRSTKPTTKPSFQLPGEATAARLKAQKEERLKRMAEAEAVKKAALAAPVRKPVAYRPRDSILVKQGPGVSIPPPSQADAPQRSTSLASVRNSISGPSVSRSTSTSSANHNSVLLAEDGKLTVTPVDAAALQSRGKQVFNRDKVEKETLERERKEKEEAAKRARAEAAERGRIASREWAERQRKKLMGAQ